MVGAKSVVPGRSTGRPGRSVRPGWVCAAWPPPAAGRDREQTNGATAALEVSVWGGGGEYVLY